MRWRGLSLLVLLDAQLRGAAYDADSSLPSLAELKVTGQLPNRKLLQVPFDPPFEADSARDHFHYSCYLDNAMEFFRLDVAGRPPSVLSKLTRDGIALASRSNLTHAQLEPGEETIFSIGVTSESTVIYTLVVHRRAGTSTELLGLRSLTGDFTAPYHSGELQEHFEVSQSFYHDHFVVEYDFADGGQNVSCNVLKSETIGDNAPTKGMMSRHPHKYLPSLEQLHAVRIKSVYNLHSAGAGPTAQCMIPIDTWRQITVALHITAADQLDHRQIRIIVTRKGCGRDQFYYQGACVMHCPTYHYTQRFNWRCAHCNRQCEFCEHWHKCTKCQRNTTMHEYVKQDDGSCKAIRVHAYKVYYKLFQYLAMSCAALLACYCLACITCLARRVCCEEDDMSKAPAEERVPLTGRTRNHSKMERKVASVGVGGHVHHAAPAE